MVVAVELLLLTVVIPTDGGLLIADDTMPVSATSIE